MSNAKFSNALDEESGSSVPSAGQVFGNLPPRRVERIKVDEKALVATGDGNFTYKRFEMTPVGMSLPEDASGEEWEEIGWALKGIDNALQWWIGDWAQFAMRHWNWTAAQVAEVFDYPPETVEVYASICGSIPGLIRNQAVYFSHHRQVAKMPEDMQRAWLDYAEFFIQQKRLKVADFKQDVATLALKTSDEQSDWIGHAMKVNRRLSQIDELKPPALLPPSGLSPAVVRGKGKANQAFKTLVEYTSGRTTLNQQQIQERGSAVIEWVRWLMEASE